MTFDPSTAKPEAQFDPRTAVPDIGPTPRQVMSVAATVDPAKALKANGLADRYGTSMSAVMPLLDKYDLQRVVDDYDRELQAAPKLASLYRQRPDYAQMTHKSIKPLAEIERTFTGTVKDVYVTAGKGFVGLGQSVVGLANLVTGGYAGRALQAAGGPFDLDMNQQVLDMLYSPAQQRSNTAVKEAKGFVDTLGAMLSNPSTIATTVGESAPMMLGGAALARGLIGLAPKVAPWLAAALGEGVMGAGSTAEQLRGKDEEGLMSIKTTFASLMSGAGTALFGAVGGKVAQRAGLADIDTVLAKGGMDEAAAGAVKRGFVSAVVRSGISEGLFEELPQSVQETMWQNWATNRPIGEGVGKAAAQGLLAGFSMGGGFQALQRALTRETDAQAALQHADILTKGMAAAAGIEARTEAPAAFRDAMRSIAGDGTVYVDAGVLNQMPAGVLEQLPEEVRTELEQAAGEDTPIGIPLADVLTVAPGTPLEEAVTQFGRAQPDAANLAEAKDVKGRAEVLRQETEQIIAQAKDQDATRASVEVVRTNLAAQIQATGRHSPAVSQAMAEWGTAFYATMAARTGMTPEQFYQQYPLRILAEPSQPGQQDVLVGQGGVKSIDPATLTFREQDQNRTEQVRKDWPEGGFPAAVTIAEADGSRTILDGHNRAAVALDLGVNIDVVDVSRDEYDRLAEAGFDDMEIAFAALDRAGEDETADRINSQFPGARVKERGRDAAQLLEQPGTTNFDNWFGDSKVVDTEGKPLVVYHGTQRAPEGITSFGARPGYAGQGGAGVTWFTTNPGAASSYADWVKGDGNSTVYPVYLSLKTPASSADYERVVSDLNARLEAEFQGLVQGMADTSVDMQQALEDFSPADTEPEIGLYDPRIVEALQQAGFDGVEFDDGDGGRVFASFRPEQIKSATGNRGTYDPADPNILNQRARTRDVGGYAVQDMPDGGLLVSGDQVEIRSLVPDGIKGRLVEGGVQFSSLNAKRVESALAGEDVTHGRAGEVIQNPRYSTGTRAGQYVGAPDQYNTPAKLPKLRRLLHQLAREGEPGRFWYERSGEAILGMVGHDREEARKFISLLAIYSPQAKVDANSTFALRAWAQYKAGKPVSVKTAVRDGQATEVLYEGKQWEGEKTNNFFRNLMREVDAELGRADRQGVTVDMWMMRAAGYDTDAPTQAAYRFVENETNRLAQELGWEPQQVQAAIWVAMKARTENAGVKKRTEAKSMAKGYMRYVDKVNPETGKTKKVREILDEVKHRKVWLDEAFALQVAEEDTNGAKFDFADGVRRHMGQVSWEARPGRTTGVLPGIHDAPYHLQAEFQKAISEIFTSIDGTDLLAQKLGLLQEGRIIAPGVWQSDIAAGEQSFFAMAPAAAGQAVLDTETWMSEKDADAKVPDWKKDERYQLKDAVDLAQRDLLGTYADIMGLLLRQEGVGWHKPFYATNKRDQNGLELRLGRPLTPVEAGAVWAAVDHEMRAAGVPDWENGAGLISSSEGIRVVNFGAMPDNTAFRKLITAAAESVPGLDAGMVGFTSDGDLRTNNWKDNPDGQDYRSRVSAAGRSDVLGWAESVLAPQIQTVFDDFSDRYGWGDPGVAPGARPAPAADGGSGLLLQGPDVNQGGPGGIPGRAVHYSKAPRASLDGRMFGTGLKGLEADRLWKSADPRLRERVYAYIDTGNGVRPEAGVGAYAHDVDLPPLYDAKADPLKIWKGSDLNATESAILDAGFAGFFVADIGNGQGAAVVIGPQSRGIPARQIDDPKRGYNPPPVGPAVYKRGLMSKEAAALEPLLPEIQAAAPSAKLRMGTLQVNVSELPAVRHIAERAGVQLPETALAQGPNATFNPKTLEIVLNPNANLSSFFHETGHFFLEVMADLADRPNAPPQVVEDMGTFLKWAGVPDLATWRAMTLDQQRPYHERWAEATEQYIMEGKAPSLELQPFMRRFAAWLKQVYGSIKKFLATRGQAAPGGVGLNQSGRQRFQLRRQAGGGTIYFDVAIEDGEMFWSMDAVNSPAKGTGAATTMFVEALGVAKSRGVAYHSESILSDESHALHARLAKVGVEFGRDGNAYTLTQEQLQALDLPAVAQRLGATYAQDPAAKSGLPMQLNDDIRRVMDRLLATDEQIAQANQVAGLLPDEEADAAAGERLAKRSIADLKWAVKARDQVITKLRKQAAAIEKETRAEVTVEVDQSPEMRAKKALDALRVSPEHQIALNEHKAARVAAEAQAREDVKAALLAENSDAVGIVKGQLLMKNKRDIDNKVESAMIAWDQANPAPKRPVNATDADVATIADSFNFTSVDEMMQAIDAYGPRKDAIDALTERRMLEEHGDLIDDDAIKQAANEAVHNEARARSLATELRTQDEMLGERTDTGITNAAGSKVTVNVLMEAAKQFGAGVAGRTVLRDLGQTIWRHTAAERRAGKRWKDATAAGKTDEAVQAKKDQVLHNAAVKALVDAKDELERTVEFFRRVTKGDDETVVTKGRDPDIVNAARAVLGAYGVQTPTTKKAGEYLAAVAQHDPPTYAVLKDVVDAATQNAQPMDALTVDELGALAEDIKSMWFLAKSSRQMEVDGKAIDINDAANEVYARLEAIGIPDTVPGETGALTKAEEMARRWLQQMPALLRRVEQWAEAKDGKFGGPFLRFIFQPVKDAADRYRTDKVAYRKRFQALLDEIAPSMRHEQIEAPELGPLGYTFGRGHNGIGTAELLHAILHTGNASNKRKLLLGRGWATEMPDGTLDTTQWDAFIQRMHGEGKLTKAHWDFVQGVWDLLEETKPLAQATHRKVFGRFFAEITAEPVDTPFGAYRGGYVPAQADPALVQDAELRDLLETENAGMAHAFPSTNRGFTKARVEYNRPLKLDLRSLPQHIDKVLMFSHMEPAVRDVGRLLQRPKVAQPLARVDPAAMGGMLKPWLVRSAKQIVETPMSADAGLNRIASTVRARVGMALMFANVSNTLQQITGALTASIKVKPSLMLRATAQFIAHPGQFKDSVWAASPYMANRASNEVAVMSDTMQRILLKPGLLENAEMWTREHAYFLQTAFDNAMSPIIWSGAYNQAVAEGMDERMAVRFADGVIRQTQGSTLPEDVSRIETGPAYARLFTQFVGYFNMMANTNATALQQVFAEQGLVKGAGKGAGVLFLGLLSPIWVAEAIALGFRGGPEDKDRDGWLDDWLLAVFGFGTIRGIFSGVPIAGQVGQSMVNQFNDTPADDKFSLSPTVSVLQSGTSAPFSVTKALADDGSQQKAVRDAAALVTVLTGLPATAAARPLGYAAGVAQGKIRPTGPADMARGLVTGVASPESKRQ
jgi:ADP-Ribosyltransferase in polyvalent proteins